MSDAGGAEVRTGAVSTIRGRWQAPALTWVTRVVIVLGVASAVVPDAVAVALATAAVATIVAAPVVRVAWLVFRWWQERDRRFMATGAALLVVVAAGAVLAALGAGR